MKTNYKEFIPKIKERHKDNDERSCYEASPCGFCEEFCKADIDNPDFGDGDWADFWRVAKEEYPLHSVCGGASWDSPAVIKKSESDMVKKHLRRIYRDDNKTSTDIINFPFLIEGKKVLEIGYGFGGAGKFMIESGADYRGIDYCSSDKSLLDGPFYEIKESGIPPELVPDGGFDLIYSYNVFQHLTQKQRFEYIEQAARYLKPDGVLFFSVFERIPGQGLRDTYSATFFNVHTKVDEPKELQDFLGESGFTFEHSARPICGETREAMYVCRKKTA